MTLFSVDMIFESTDYTDFAGKRNQLGGFRAVWYPTRSVDMNLAVAFKPRRSAPKTLRRVATIERQSSLPSFLIRPRKKAGLRFGVLRKIGFRLLSRVGAFQFIFLNFFQPTLFCALIHEEIIA
jgi:hypothetical protein